jgi:uncharacterized phage protein gp47/JayE
LSTQLDNDADPFELPIATSADEVRQEIADEFSDNVPGFALLPTSPLTHLVGALAAVSAESRDALQARIRTELMSLIGTLFRLPRSDGAPASSTITVTALDTLGHTIEGPVPVSLGDVQMETTTDVVIPVGQTSATVPVVTVDWSSAANGATATVATPVTLDTAADWLAEASPVVLDAPLAGGADPENDTAYMVRLIEELSILSPSPILPRSYAVLARRHPSVVYAWCRRTYNGATGTDGVPHHVTVWVAGADGRSPGTTAIAEVFNAISLLLLDNVVLHVLPPTIVPIDVNATVRPRYGWAPGDAESAGTQRLQQVLAPAAWCAPQFGDAINPTPDDLVHVNDLIARLDEVDAIQVPETLEINGGAATSVTLGFGELPEPRAITVTSI